MSLVVSPPPPPIIQSSAGVINVSKIEIDESICSDTYLKDCLNKENCLQCNLESNNNNHHDHHHHLHHHHHHAIITPTPESSVNLLNDCNCIDDDHDDCVINDRRDDNDNDNDDSQRNNNLNVWQVSTKLNDFNNQDDNDSLLTIDTLAPPPKSADTITSVTSSMIDPTSFIIYSGTPARTPDVTASAINTDLIVKDDYNVSTNPTNAPSKLTNKSLHSRSSFDENQIICHDLNGSSSKNYELVGSPKKKIGTTSNGTKQSSPKTSKENDSSRDRDRNHDDKRRENCIDCCFCNPDIHWNGKKSKNVNDNGGVGGGKGTCDFCKKKETPRVDNLNDDSYSDITIEYLSSKITDHTHTKTKTKSRNSPGGHGADESIISTKCVKTNQKIQRTFIPLTPSTGNTSEMKTTTPQAQTSLSQQRDKSKTQQSQQQQQQQSPPKQQPQPPKMTDDKLNRPKNVNNIPRARSLQSFQKIIHNELSACNAFKKNKSPINSNGKTPTTTTNGFRLPSPYNTGTDITSIYDSSCSSPDSSLERFKNKSNVAAAQQAALRWQNHAHHQKYMNSSRGRRMSRQQEFYQNSHNSNLGQMEKKGVGSSKWGPKTDGGDNNSNNNPGNFVVLR